MRRIYQRHFDRLNDIYQSQGRVYEAGGVLAPLIAVQSLSMGLSGSDLAHHRHFGEAAEQYRRTLVNMLNEEIVAQGNSELIWDFKGDRSLWERGRAVPLRLSGAGMGAPQSRAEPRAAGVVADRRARGHAVDRRGSEGGLRCCCEPSGTTGATWPPTALPSSYS